MIVSVNFNQEVYTADLHAPIDISIPLENKWPQVNCFGAPMFETKPLRSGDFVGSTQHGSPVNFYNIQLNPHGNGTHTECVGHISKETFHINACYTPKLETAQLVSIYPQLEDNGDRVITAYHLEQMWDFAGEKALIVRTLPNDEGKLTRGYTHANPPYFSEDAIRFIVSRGIQHLLTDLPSVDPEVDGGALRAHRAFWDYPSDNVRIMNTITELIYVPDTVFDGIYLLHLQFLNIALDASPSRPFLYKLM